MLLLFSIICSMVIFVGDNLNASEQKRLRDKQLLETAASGNEVKMRYLLDVEPTDCMGLTPLLRAVKGGHAGMVEILLKAGASPEATSRSGETASEMALRQNRVDIAQILLGYRSSPSRIDSKE